MIITSSNDYNKKMELEEQNLRNKEESSLDFIKPKVIKSWASV